MPDEVVVLERSLSAVAVELFGAGSVQGTLQRIVDLARSTVDGCDAAGIAVLDGAAPPTTASTEAMVDELEWAQVDLGEGPCVDAAESGTTCYASDLADDGRWPRFAPVAVGAGIRSILAYPLSEQRRGTLTLYARLPAAFGATDRAQGQLFATLARLAVDSAEERAAEEARAEHFADALRSRDVIGQAQGILMEREQISAEQALEILRRASQRMNVKLRDVARDVVDRLPGEGHDPQAP